MGCNLPVGLSVRSRLASCVATPAEPCFVLCTFRSFPLYPLQSRAVLPPDSDLEMNYTVQTCLGKCGQPTRRLIYDCMVAVDFIYPDHYPPSFKVLSYYPSEVGDFDRYDRYSKYIIPTYVRRPDASKRSTTIVRLHIYYSIGFFFSFLLS